MKINGTYVLPCSQQRAWEALNDPELLKASLKGCERLEKLSDTEFAGTVATKIGPVSARFSGTMRLENVQAPDSCDMVFEGQGGVAGFARGSATVTLAPDGAGARLTYTADTAVGGKLAQIGTRLVEGTARAMADDFFGKFCGLLATGSEATTEPAAVAQEPDTVAPASPSGQRLTVFLVLGVVLAVAALYATFG
jgi:carbon monoxide dehydrogenase subunit G